MTIIHKHDLTTSLNDAVYLFVFVKRIIVRVKMMDYSRSTRHINIADMANQISIWVKDQQ